MVTCATCGHLLEETASLCDRCGAPVPTRVEAPAAALAATALGAEPLMPESGLLRAGQLFDGKYRIERQIGAGGMSVVYLATEITVEAKVVIKALLPHLSHQPSIRERLLREAKALARIDHPNVVGLKSVVSAGAELFLVMEFVEGQDLAARIDRWKNEGHPPVHEVIALFHPILDGVEAAHQSGIVHRDLKPSNVLLRARDGRVKVTDFGIAKSASESDHQLTSGMIGTMLYMAPEQLRADPTIDPRADIYALGILLFELLAGRVPFQAVSGYEIARQHMQVPLPSLRSAAPSLPLSDEAVALLDVILARACAKDRDHRYASCDEFREALLQCAPALQPMAPTLASAAPISLARPPANPPAPSSPAPSSRPVASRSGVALLLVPLVVLAGVAVWWFTPGQDPPKKPAQPPAPTPTRAVPPSAAPVVSTPPASPAAVAACSRPDDCKANAPRNSAPTCVRGRCGFQCQAGYHDCGDQCLNLSSDVKHCGSCGGPGSDCTLQPLPPGAAATCDKGRCSFSCKEGERCGPLCCAQGQRCDEGKCAAGDAQKLRLKGIGLPEKGGIDRGAQARSRHRTSSTGRFCGDGVSCSLPSGVTPKLTCVAPVERWVMAQVFASCSASFSSFRSALASATRSGAAIRAGW
jgi:serine/threonine protein kinase